MKTTRNIILAGLLLISSIGALAASIDVRLNPNPTAPVIGTLESQSLAVAAEWPEGIEPQPGWRPIFFQNEFTVFIPNGDLGKDLSPKVGVPYLLSPSPDAPQIALATAEDDAELLSVDPRYARIRLSTVVLSYIPDTTPQPQVSSPPVVQPEMRVTSPSGGSGTVFDATPSDHTVKTLSGILVKANAFERNRFGLQYKLINHENTTLAFVNTAGLAKFVLVTDYVNTKIEVTGPIEKAEKGDKLIITAQTLKKAI